MTLAGTIKMTARQFLRLGEDPPGVRLELVDGEIAVSPSPTPRHQRASLRLSTILDTYTVEHNLGEVIPDVDTIFGEHDVRRPDLIYFSQERVHFVGEDAINGPPDLCVEVVSPSSTKTDRVDKFKQYEAGDVLHYWILDPHEKSLEGYGLHRGKYVLAGRLQGEEMAFLPPFPHLAIPLAKLWMKSTLTKQANRSKRKPK